MVTRYNLNTVLPLNIIDNSLKKGHVSGGTLSEYVRVLNRQLSTLKILDNKLTQFL